MSAPDVARYLRLIEHDLEVLKLLAGAAKARGGVDVSDWKCTLLFYMACIYIKAFGRTQGKELQDHYNVKQWMNTTRELLPIAKPYRKLEERSREARYEGRKYDASEASQHARWFQEVRDGVVALLRSSGVANPPSVDPVSFL